MKWIATLLLVAYRRYILISVILPTPARNLSMSCTVTGECVSIGKQPMLYAFGAPLTDFSPVCRELRCDAD